MDHQVLPRLHEFNIIVRKSANEEIAGVRRSSPPDMNRRLPSMLPSDDRNRVLPEPWRSRRRKSSAQGREDCARARRLIEMVMQGESSLCHRR